jgi:hypothetical protein
MSLSTSYPAPCKRTAHLQVHISPRIHIAPIAIKVSSPDEPKRPLPLHPPKLPRLPLPALYQTMQVIAPVHPSLLRGHTGSEGAFPVGQDTLDDGLSGDENVGDGR